MSHKASIQLRQAKDTSGRLLLRHVLSLSLRQLSLAAVNQQQTKPSIHVQLPTLSSDSSIYQPHRTTNRDQLCVMSNAPHLWLWFHL